MSKEGHADTLKSEALPNKAVDAVEEGKLTEYTLDIVQASDEYTEEQYRKLVRKIDFILLPLMWIISGTQYADKASISTQSTFGLREDTHLVGQQYSCIFKHIGQCLSMWLTLTGLTSIFYIAFLVSEAPGNYVLQRFGPKYTVSCCMFSWGEYIHLRMAVWFVNDF